MTSLYRSEQGKKAILHLYDEKLESLSIEYQYKIVDTSFGKTNVIVTGEPSNPPLFIIHGSNGCAPISLETYPNLSTQFQVFAVDVLAQPNKSAEIRLSMKDDSYGKWMNEIIVSLKLDKVTLVGFSFGGLAILKTLINNESKIKEVYLSAPAYIVNGNPLKALFKVFIPMKWFIRTKKIKFLEKFLDEIFTEKDEFAVKYLSQVFLHFNMDFTPVPIISKTEAQKITTPITLIAAKKDIMFPGEKMLKRASKIFTSLKRTVLLEDSKHVLNSMDNAKIEELILTK
ncbi:alpha/beta fold hydrolase [Flagellimonas pacifica]|uniref:Pimeloyl-ACP methyl ester carboxylesterase n=1 Tax=Flagellimonas pacifica TaxID=1247520 RepID=A0A285MCX0_9FLAO|nr:alpha/beta hydrolase [Allomuricauda parva]SNY94979.1 Pimeloyl-ACP methyl ester carboxylesterase [Allomuricauda parva]